MTIRVVAHLTAREDRIAAAQEALIGLISPTREEPGCIGYELMQNVDDPAQFTFVEEWRDAADLEAHFRSEHIAALLVRFDELFATEMDLRKYSQVG